VTTLDKEVELIWVNLVCFSIPF